MNVKISLVVVILSVTIFSCKNKAKNNMKYDPLKFHTKYYKDGTLRKVLEFTFDNPSGDGLYLYYFPDGTLQDSGTVIRDSFIGKRKIYNESGHLKKIMNYLDGEVRSVIRYYPSGNMSSYRGFDYDGDFMYHLKFDKMGNFSRNENFLFYAWILEDNYPIDSNIIFDILLPKIEGFDVSVNVEKLKNDEYMHLETLQPDENNSISYSTFLNSEENLQLRHIAKMERNGDLILTDTLVFTIDKETGGAYDYHSNG